MHSEHQSEFNTVISDERSERQEEQATLQGLSGYARLSEDQQRYILASLYIQQRAERGTDPVSNARIQEMPSMFKQNAPGRAYIAHPRHPISNTDELRENSERYLTSQVHIMSEYCHHAVVQLESYQHQETPPQSWSDAGPIVSYNELLDLVQLTEERAQPPFVIEIWDHPHSENDAAHRLHSTVLLGQRDDGEWIAWEKSGFSLPYQLIPLSQLYYTYHSCYGWRMRPLAV